MMIRKPERSRVILIGGDLIVLLLTTVVGFVDHGELASAGLIRMAATLVPFGFAWFVVSPWLGCFDGERMTRLAELWRPTLAAMLAAPLGAVLRGLWLRAPVVPPFAIVMGAVLAAALLAWRLVAAIVIRRVTATGA